MRRRKYAITDLDNTISVNFDNTAYVVSQMDLGSIDANLSSYSGAGQYGATITSRSFGTRDVVIEGHIPANDKETMDNRKEILQKITAPTGDFYLVVDDYRIRLTANSTIEYSKDWFRNNEYLTSFTIDAVAANPFFETYTARTANITGWVSDFHFPFYNEVGQRFTTGHRSESKIVDVYNDSEVETGLIISFKAIGGTIVKPKLENVVDNTFIKINATIQSGEEVIINTNYGRKSIINATTKENWLKHLDLNSTWLQMPVGLSSFKFDYEPSSTGTLECNATYLPQRIEV